MIDVMAGITNGQEDVALVYDNAELLGIFTEFDYISVSLSFVFLMGNLAKVSVTYFLKQLNVPFIYDIFMRGSFSISFGELPRLVLNSC